jgi:hypothetical protein
MIADSDKNVKSRISRHQNGITVCTSQVQAEIFPYRCERAFNDTAHSEAELSGKMLSIYVRKLVVFVFTFYLFKDTSYFLATG